MPAIFPPAERRNSNCCRIMRVIRTRSTDVWRNLAVEEWLLSTPTIPPPVLFLWQSEAAVVIGKNQNPWSECAPGRLEQLGVRLARRVSGGGTVYHDLGNLNYAFIALRSEYHRDRYFNLVLSALEKLGIVAERMGRNSLGIQGRKISGNAFCYRKDRVLHHGTLLISANLDRLEEALRPPPLRIQTRAVASERAPVVNLRQLASSLTVDQVAAALIETAAGSPREPRDDTNLDANAIETLRRRNATPEWLFERTPPFEVEWTMSLSAGSICVRAVVEKARLIRVRCKVAPPLLETAGLISRRLEDCPFHATELAQRLALVPALAEAVAWLEREGF